MDLDLIIIGGGLAGSSLAYYAATAGLGTLLLEQTCLGAGGATRASRGIVRVYDPDPVLMSWNARGLAHWQLLAEEEGAAFVACGVLYFIAPAEQAQVQERMRDFPEWGRSVELLHETQLRARYAWLSQDTRADSTHGPTPLMAIHEAASGYCEPRHTSQLLGMRAREKGACVLEGVEVLSLRQAGDRVVLGTEDAEFSAPYAVVAAGAGSQQFLPSTPGEQRQIGLSTLLSGHPPLSCCVVDGVSGSYARPEGTGEIFHCGGEPFTPDTHSASLHRANRQRLSRWYDNADSLTPVAMHASEDLYTPDFHPLIGMPGEGQSRVLPLTGFSGRGAKYIPAAASELAHRLSHSVRGTG
jgi:glycine/D-amino acid oxidase-like deaminating enzyme